MNRLFAAFDEAAASHRQVVTGDAGIGKTSLCEAFLRVAPTRHAIRATWAQHALRAVGAAPSAADLPTRLARSADDDTVATILSRHAPSWRICPRSRRRPRARLPRGHTSTAARMLREVVTALEALAEETTLVVWIEDLQWADAATMDVLASLGQRRDPAKILPATVRPVEPVAASAPLRRAQFDLRARECDRTQAAGADLRGRDAVSRPAARLGCVWSILAPVTPDDERQSAVPADGDRPPRAQGPHPREWQRVAVEALLDALEAAVPASLVTVVGELDELAPDERQAIDAAAVVGVEFALAARAADVDELALEPVLE